MNAYAPMVASPYGGSLSPQAQAIPYSAPQPFGFGAPIPLTPAVLPAVDDGAIVEEEAAGGFLAKKLFGLPIVAIALIPLAIVVAVVVAVVAVRAVVVVVALVSPDLAKRLFGVTGAAPAAKPAYEEQPYQSYQPQPEYNYNNNYSNNGMKGKPDGRRRRELKSATPSLTVGQVEKLTTVVMSALRNEECSKRIICELGNFSSGFSTAQTVAKSIENFVPEFLKDDYDIFVSGQGCDKYSCGKLPVKK